MVKQRRSKRKTAMPTRFSARKAARVQEDSEIYGMDYGVLPSGACVSARFVAVVVGLEAKQCGLSGGSISRCYPSLSLTHTHTHSFLLLACWLAMTD